MIILSTSGSFDIQSPQQRNKKNIFSVVVSTAKNIISVTKGHLLLSGRGSVSGVKKSRFAELLYTSYTVARQATLSRPPRNNSGVTFTSALTLVQSKPLSDGWRLVSEERSWNGIKGKVSILQLFYFSELILHSNTHIEYHKSKKKSVYFTLTSILCFLLSSNGTQKKEY